MIHAPLSAGPTLLLRAALAALVVLLAACTSTDDTSSHGLAEGCAINSDCNSPLVCAFKKCHAACATTRDCPAGERCLASDRPFHVCQLPVEQRCSYNSDCGQGQLCAIDGQCRDQCAADRDCVSGQLCSAGTCAEPSELDAGHLAPQPDAQPEASHPCVYNSECSSPLVCRGGQCLAECIADTDCRGNARCVGQRCSPAICGGHDGGPAAQAGAACAYSSQCPEGLVCRGGVCNCECLASPDCNAGFECVDSRCLPHGAPDAGVDAPADVSSERGDADSAAEAGPPQPGVVDLASGQGKVNGLVVVDTRVYFTSETNRTLASCPLFGGGPTTVHASNQNVPGALLQMNGKLFWTVQGATAGAGEVHSCDPSDCANTLGTFVQALRSPVALASDGVTLFIGVAGTAAQSFADAGVVACDLGGCQGAGSFVAGVRPRALATNASNILWTDSIATTVSSVPFAGGAPTVIGTVPGAPHGIAANDTRAYVTTASGKVYACDTAGGTTPTLLGSGPPDGEGIAVDAYHVFWVADGDATNNHFSAVMRCPLAGCGPGGPVQLAFDPIGAPIALDGPNVFFTADGFIRKVPKLLCTAPAADCDGDPATVCEVDTTSDLLNCGACGAVCGTDRASPTCSGGVCTLNCQQGYLDCDGNPSNGCEVDQNGANPANCGSCGAVCGTQNASQASCIDGTCSEQCDSGYLDCDGDPSNGCEVDFSNDVQHCGNCSNVCGTAHTTAVSCGDGCDLTCVTGFGNCDYISNNGCELPLDSDTSNCGGCFHVCGTANTTAVACGGGTCTETCALYFGDCDGNSYNGCEADTRVDPFNCNGCGNPCPANYSCVQGVCLGP